MVNRIFHPCFVVSILFLLSVGVMTTVLISQYLFHLYPCELCLLQRPTWWGVMGFSATGIGLFFFLKRMGVLIRIIIALCALLLLIGAGVAFYHVGVEYKWWSGPLACSLGVSSGLSSQQVMTLFKKGPLVSCQTPTFILFGISMAGYNVIISVVLATYALISLFKKKGKHHG